MKNISITVTNITNPTPAIKTSAFQVYVGLNQTDISANNSITFVQLIAAQMSCIVTFSPSTVSTSSTMIVSVTPTNSIPSTTGSISIQFTPNGYWTNSLNTTNRFNSTSVSCAKVSGSIGNPSCSWGDNYILTAGSLFPNNTSTNFVFSVSPIKSPPSP